MLRIIRLKYFTFLDIETMLFGVGGLGEDNKAILDPFEIKYADFGLIMIMVMGGGIIFMLIIIAFMKYFFEKLFLLNSEWEWYKSFNSNARCYAFCHHFWINSFNYSLYKYIATCRKHLYAFIISISLYCTYLLKDQKKGFDGKI